MVLICCNFHFPTFDAPFVTVPYAGRGRGPDDQFRGSWCVEDTKRTQEEVQKGASNVGK